MRAKPNKPTLWTFLVETRRKLIANVDPIPSANDNLLLIRGTCNTVFDFANEVTNSLVNSAEQAMTRLWSRYREPFWAYAATPVSIALLILVEGSIIWHVQSIEDAVQESMNQPTLELAEISGSKR